MSIRGPLDADSSMLAPLVLFPGFAELVSLNVGQDITELVKGSTGRAIHMLVLALQKIRDPYGTPAAGNAPGPNHWLMQDGANLMPLHAPEKPVRAHLGPSG